MNNESHENYLTVKLSENSEAVPDSTCENTNSSNFHSECALIKNELPSSFTPVAEKENGIALDNNFDFIGKSETGNLSNSVELTKVYNEQFVCTFENLPESPSYLRCPIDSPNITCSKNDVKCNNENSSYFTELLQTSDITSPTVSSQCSFVTCDMPTSEGSFSLDVMSSTSSSFVTCNSVSEFSEDTKDSGVTTDSNFTPKYKTDKIKRSSPPTLAKVKKNQACKITQSRSGPVDFKELKDMSSSEIANTFLPSSLKNIVPKLSSQEIHDGSYTSPRSNLNSSSLSGVPFTRNKFRHSLLTPRSSLPGNILSRSFSMRKSSLGMKIGESCCPIHGVQKEITGGRKYSCPAKMLSNDPRTLHKDPIQFRNICSRNFLPFDSETISISSSSIHSLKCGICDRMLTNSKVLPCLHRFCEKCLIRYTPSQSLTLTCPLCRQQSILPKDGVSGLRTPDLSKRRQINIQTRPQSPLKSCHCFNCGIKSTMKCIICDTIFCSNCVHHHDEESSCSDSISVTSQEESIPRPSPATSFESTMTSCASHPDQSLTLFCKNCQTPICTTCVNSHHTSHTTISLEEQIVDHVIPFEDIRHLMDKVTVQLPCMKEVLCDLTDVSEQLDNNYKNCETEVKEYFRDLRKILEDREAELLSNLQCEFVRKKEVIAAQRLELDEWVKGVNNICECVENAAEASTKSVPISNKLENYSSVEFPPVLRENSHIRYVEGRLDFVGNILRDVGKIQTNSAVPQQTTAIGDNLRKICVERQCVVTVVTRDYKGNKMKSGGSDIQATIKKNIASINGYSHSSSSCEPKKPDERLVRVRKDTSPVQVVDLNDGTYEIFFTVRSIGTYSLAIFLHGQHISASPFTLTARMSTDSGTWSDVGSFSCNETSFIRRKSLNTVQISRKSSLSSNKHAHSHRSSCSRRTVKEPFEDDLIMKVGRKGRSRGEFVNPQGVCFAPIKDGRIAVSDSNGQCVQIFDLTGECKVKFGVRGRSAGQLQRPTGITCLPDGNYAVADYENKWVSVFEPSGKYIRRIGQGKLIGPKGLCVGSEGNLIVVDNKASCVFIFSLSGKLLRKFGNRSLEGYNFAGPHFCAVNSWGDIIITDFHNHCVRVFSAEGVAKLSFGTNGEGNGQFNAPTGVAVDANHNIIVADWGNSRIQVFDSQGSFLSFVSTITDPLYGPQGLCLTSDGHIIVADSGNHCFKLYKYLQ